MYTLDGIDTQITSKWTGSDIVKENYTGTSILEKIFSRSSLDEITCSSILASGPHLGAVITSDNIFR